MRWFAWAREVKEKLVYNYNRLIVAIFIERDLQEIVMLSDQLMERSSLNFYMQGSVKQNQPRNFKV